MKKFRNTALTVTSTLLPMVALANPAPVNDADFGWITSVLTQVGNVVSTAVPLLLGIALLVFIWGVVRFMSTDDDSTRNDGKRKMIWGVVGLFVIVSVWGLVILLQTLVGIEGQDAIAPPQIPAYGE